MSVIDEVKQRTDIVEVISQDTSLTKAGRLLKGLCPFHSEKHASFFVYPEQQSWHCFGACNTGGDIFSFVMKKQNLSFGEALRLLAERAGVDIPSISRPQADRDLKERLYQANAAAAQYFHNLLLNSTEAEKVRQYVTRRGLETKSVSDFQLGYSLNSRQDLKQYLMERDYTEGEQLEAGLIIKMDDGKSHDRFRNMLMFPIGDARGRIVGFGARVLGDTGPKYTNSPQTPLFDKSSLLYGLSLAAAAIRQQDSAIIVEGYMDTITTHQNGFTNVVASMGTSVTERQINALKRLTRNIAFALDADAAGEEATLRGVGYENILDAEVKVIILPQGKDPDDVIRQDKEDWCRLVDEAQPVIDYTFDRATAELDLNSARDKSRLASRLLPTIAEIKDTVRQAHYLQKLARLVRVSERKLEAALGKVRLGQGRGKPGVIRPATTQRPVLADSLEDYCLALLLQHPELKAGGDELLPEYFDSSENREILIALKQAKEVSRLKEGLDSALWPHLEDLTQRSLTEDQLELKLADCILRLREKSLRGLATKIEEILISEANKGTSAELIKFKEQGIEVGLELAEIFGQRERRHREQRR